MKKFAICLLVLSSISTAAVAEQGNRDLRDSNTCCGEHSNGGVNAQAIADEAGAATNPRRLKENLEENRSGESHRDGRSQGGKS